MKTKPIEDMTRDELAIYAKRLLSMIANLQAANAKLIKPNDPVVAPPTLDSDLPKDVPGG